LVRDWPRIGKGRNRQFFKNKKESRDCFAAKAIEQETTGYRWRLVNERHRAEYLECAELTSRSAATIRDAVNSYIPHLRR